MRRRWAGIVGITIAVVAVMATICAEHVLPEPPTPKLQSTLSLNIGKLNLSWRPKVQEAQPPAQEPLLNRDLVRRAGTLLGTLALPFAIFSWVRRERAWWGLGICGFAIAAIAWQTFAPVFALLLLCGVAILLLEFPALGEHLLSIGATRSPQHERRARRRVAVWYALCLVVMVYVAVWGLDLYWTPWTITYGILLLLIAGGVVVGCLWISFASKE